MCLYTPPNPSQWSKYNIRTRKKRWLARLELSVVGWKGLKTGHVPSAVDVISSYYWAYRNWKILSLYNIVDAYWESSHIKVFPSIKIHQKVPSYKWDSSQLHDALSILRKYCGNVPAHNIISTEDFWSFDFEIKSGAHRHCYSFYIPVYSLWCMCSCCLKRWNRMCSFIVIYNLLLVDSYIWTPSRASPGRGQIKTQQQSKRNKRNRKSKVVTRLNERDDQQQRQRVSSVQYYLSFLYIKYILYRRGWHFFWRYKRY